MKKNRLQLFVVLFVVFLASFVNMNMKYDPLARNTSVNANNRQALMKYLTSDDLRYVVENNLDVNEFTEFIAEPLFLLANYKLYRQAMDLKPSTTREIVTFINAVVNKIEVTDLLQAIPNYSYAALRKLVVDRSPYNHNAAIVLNPNDILTFLDLKSTIGEYEPTDLVLLASLPGLAQQDSTLSLRKEVANAFSGLCLYLASNDGRDCGGFVVTTAYLDYFTIQDRYLAAVESDGPQKAFDAWGMPSHNEHQLGLSIDIAHGSGQPLESLEEYLVLQDKAADFGFLFYPVDEKMPLFHIQQSNHLRYVGVEEAQRCQAGSCFYHQ